MIAMSAPLADVLEHLVLLMESQFKGIVGSVLLLDETGTRLRHGAAPSLPDAYAKADRRRAHRPQSGLERHGRLSAGSRRRRRRHDRPAVGGLQGRWRPSTGFVHAGRRRSCRIRARFSAYSRCIRRNRANRPTPRCASSMSRPASPASRSNASWPKTAFISWPTMTR